MRISHALAGAAVVALFSSATASAANLIANPDFTADITTAWTSSGTGGGATFNPGQGSPVPGSAQLSASFDIAGVYVTRSLTQCVAFAAPGSFDLIAHTFTGANTGSALFSVRVTFFDAGLCGGANLGTSVAGAVVDLGTGWWERSLVGAPIPGTALSANVELFVDSGTTAGSSSDILFDNVRFGPAGTVPVQLQRFSVE